MFEHTTPGEPRPDLSVIIASADHRDLLEQCLTSLRELPDPVSVEVIVVDNGSSDGTSQMVRRRFPTVTLIRNETNTGFARANNQGLALSTGRYVMLLNNDTIVRANALNRLVSFMDRHPDVGACGPRLLYPDGTVQRSTLGFPSPVGYLGCVLWLDRLFRYSGPFTYQETGFSHGYTTEVDHPIGAALVVRRDTLEEVGGLDERFRIHFNDVDWCYRMKKAGWRRFFVHDAVVVHYGGRTLGAGGERLRFQGEIVRNLFDYFRKHFGLAGLLWLRILTVTGLAPRYLGFRLLSRVRPNDLLAHRIRHDRGMVRAAWSGNPDQFMPDPTVRRSTIG